MLQGLYFGALLIYKPLDERCVYLNDDNGKAVIILYNSEQPVRVDYEHLGWYRLR